MSNNNTDLTLEELEQIHSTFIEIAAHKLLSPLTIINWNVELIMKNDDLPDDVKAKLIDIDINTKKLKDLSNTLIKISELKGGSYADAVYEVDINKLIKGVLHEYDEVIISKKLKTQVKIEKDMVNISISENMLKEVVRSIVGNAALYNCDSGELIIQSKVDDSKLNIEVTDSGIGLSEDEIQIIPQMFYRAKNAQLSEVKGNGLSLYYADLVIKKADGNMELVSLDNGLQVKLILPIG